MCVQQSPVGIFRQESLDEWRSVSNISKPFCILLPYISLNRITFKENIYTFNKILYTIVLLLHIIHNLRNIWSFSFSRHAFSTLTRVFSSKVHKSPPIAIDVNWGQWQRSMHPLVTTKSQVYNPNLSFATRYFTLGLRTSFPQRVDLM
jgi:hypothetical protein